MRKKLLRSRSGFEKPESREEAIMQNILGASNVLEPSESNIEEILKSILYNTPYTKEAEFEIEKILLAIKNNGTYDGECESRDLKILFAILNDLDYTEEAESRIEELFIEWLQQRSQIKVLEGIPPLPFTSRGLPLINYLIEGNAVQNGTPTPASPVDVQGVGTLDNGQYKIPISSANTTTPIYLGEVQSTRRIRKYEFTGQENILQGSENYYASLPAPGVPHSNMYCTHNVYGACSVNNNGGYIWLKISSWSDYATAEDLKAFFRQEYAAGTPVTVWYVLANEETAVVNEPLMKIGEYADTVSMEQTGIEIPTINGSNTFDVNTTVKPSNVYIEYK
jgi:hypothetical protein